MKTRLLVLLLLLPFAVGCKSATKDQIDKGLVYELDKKWEPLEYIRQRPALVSHLGFSDTATTTIGRSAYVHDLKKWLVKRPPGSKMFIALMEHEQAHAKRQEKTGVFLWVTRYTYDKKFAWFEEQCGWYYEIMAMRRLGLRPNPDGIAIVLSKYKNLAGRLVKFPEAKQWVLDVLAGKWKPPED